MDRSFTSGVLTPRRSAPYNSIVFSRADKSNRAANFEDSGSSSLVNVHLSKFGICVIAQVAIEMQLAMQRPFNATTHQKLRTRGTDDHQEIAARGCYDYVHSKKGPFARQMARERELYRPTSQRITAAKR